MVFRDSGRIEKYELSVSVNGHQLGKLRQRQFFALSLEPGEYEVRSEGSLWNVFGTTRAIRVDVRPDATTYLELVVAPGDGAIANHHNLLRHDAEVKAVVEKLEQVGAR